MAKKLAFHSNKGGVYKISTTVSVAINLAKNGYKTLIVDCDAQNNVVLNFDYVTSNINKTLYELVLSKTKVKSEILEYINNVEDNIDIISNSFESLNIDYSIYTNNKEFPNVLSLFSFIESIEDDYDFILFDLSAAYTLFNLNALKIIDNVIVLTELEPFSIKGLIANLDILKDLNVNILGVLRTKIEPNTKYFKEINKQLLENMDKIGINVFNTKINKKAEQVNSLMFKGENISLSSSSAKTSYDYKNLTKEILKGIN